MHLKMDAWQSEWTNEENSDIDFNISNSAQLDFMYNVVDNAVYSPNVSRDDSIESCEEEQADKNDCSVIKPTFKSVLQAKKRLQAFSAVKQLKRTASKDDKMEEGERSDKISPKKKKRGLYPDDKAKAVIQEIEEIKLKEFKVAMDDQVQRDIAITAAMKATISLQHAPRARSRSLSSERERFRRREIKSRNNYRRSDSFNRKSPSPGEYNKRSDRKSPMQKLLYPKNWTEYKQQNLTLVKDDELKSKVFPKVKYTQHELVARFINFVTPSPLIESFKSFTVEDKVENIPFSFLRVTRSKPSVTYSINARKNKDSYITRKQLFQIIPRDRRDIIEKLINTPSRAQPRCKSSHTRQWYLKSWKKSADAECKVLENSVGLSFLQTYSDEEEDNETEEVVICSSTKENVAKKNAARKAQMPEKKMANKLEPQKKEELKLNLLQDDTFLSNDTTIIAKQREIEYEGNLTPEKKPAIVKKTQKDEIIETRRAIKELEEELERRKASNIEEESKDKPTKKKKKKKVKRKEESSNSEIDIETRKRKRKKRKKTKKKKYVDEDMSCSENEKRKKKRSKKPNLKIKSKKKKEKPKKEEPSGKEHKKKKDEDTKESNYVEESKRKRKKSNIDEENVHETNISSVEDTSLTIERKRRKEKKKNNKKNKLVDKETEISENIIEDNVTKDMKKQSKNAEKEYKTTAYRENIKPEKKGRKSSTSSTDNESTNVEKELFYEKEGKSEKRSRKNSKDFDIDLKCQSKTNLEKGTTRKCDTELKSREKSLKNERDSKKFYQDDRSKIDVQISEKETKRTKEHIEKSHKHDDNTRKKNTVEDIKIIKDAEYSKKSNEKLDKKHSEKEKQTESSKRSGEKSEDRDKCEVINRSHRSFRGSSENLEKHREAENYKTRHADKSEKIDKHQKDRKHKEEHFEKIDKGRSEKIDKGRSEKVDKGRSEKIDKGHSEKVDKERSEKIEKGYSEKVDKERSEKIDKGHSEKVDKERSEKVDKERSEKVVKERSEKMDKDLSEKQDNTTKEEPDWEKLRCKRNRHRNSDSKESNKDILETICLSEDIEAFPLEKEDYQLKEKEESKAPSTKSKEEHKQREIGTPDTDEYRENWEKDPFPIWESEDEAPPKPREKLNTSWESDEEIFERGHRIVATTRPFNDTFDLEIPLNIKPFKKREIIDSDKELQLLKRQSKTLSEERRRLEIEKLRVKELELKVIRETENISKEDHHKPKRRRSQDEKSSKISEQDKEVVVKKGRWDKRVPQFKTSTPKVDITHLSRIKKEKIINDDSSTNVSSSTSLNNTSAVLENEYEEFMKAVTSSTSPKIRKEKKRSKTKESSSSDSNFSISSDSEISHVKKQVIQKQDNQDQNKDNVMINLDAQIETLVDSPSNHTLTIVPKDVSLIPMPLPQTEIKPVPVPSPKIDLEKIPKPLINLSLSTNITLDMASQLAASFHSPVAKILELATNPPPAPPSIVHSPMLQKPEVTVPVQKANLEAVSFASPLTDASLDSVLFDDKSKDGERRLNDKPFVFTSMVLTSKRPLLNNSKLNLGDSDDEKDNAVKSIKKLEEIKKEYLTDSVNIPVENTEVHIESAKKISSEVVEECVLGNKEGSGSKHSPSKKPESKKTSSSEKIDKMEASPRKISHTRREPSPRRRNREPSPKRRRISPRRHSSPRRRSPPRRKSSPVRKRHSPRRSMSPKYRKRSISPKRRILSPRRSISPRVRTNSPRRSISPRTRAISPRRSISPRVRISSPRRSISPRTRAISPRSISPRIRIRTSSPKDNKVKSPEKFTSNISVSLQENPFTDHHRHKSPAKSVITSPLEGLKRSVADSTISDDSLLQPTPNIEEYTESPISRFYDRTSKALDSPKRVPLDIRISQVLGLKEEPPKPITTTYASYNYEYNQYSQQISGLLDQKSSVKPVPKSYNRFDIQPMKSNFVQVGNMVRIVPTEDIPTMEIKKVPLPPPKVAPSSSIKPPKTPVIHKKETSQIVQVGNMLQIVPADLPLVPPLPPEPKVEVPKESTPAPPIVQVQEKPSAEAAMKLKVAERRAEREKRRQDRERRRKEKDKRRKEKEKQKQIKLKQRTENMIKKALQLEVEGAVEDEEDMVLSEMPAQWPPLPIIVSSVSKETSRSILIRGSKRNESARLDKPKIVQFADGVRPGEGTSPSGGEELSSPPPSKKLPKEKRFKKTKLLQKNQKKKVKVKVIKKRPETEESDEEDILPPPSPPPGSPPPHLFPPRIKVHAINNIHPYIPNVVPIPTSQQLYRPPPQLNIIMHPHHHGPPPPHHHGPPPHHHGPPHHHHGPPPPPGPHFPHGPPPHHHGPPPPPPHHGPPPPPHHGPGWGWGPSAPPYDPHWPHHHGPPPPPYHH